MAHSFGGVRLARASSIGNPITVNVTTVAGDTVIWLPLKVVGAVDRAGGAPTLNGLPLTSATSVPQKAVVTPEASLEVWYLSDPPIGTFSLVIPNTAGLTVFRHVTAAQASSGRTSRLRGVSSAALTAVNPSPGAIDCQSGDIVAASVAGGWTTWAPTAQAGTVILNVDDGVHGEGAQYSIRTSDGPFALGWTLNVSDDWGAIAVAFREVRVQVIPSALRQAGTHDTPSITVAADRSYLLTVTMDAADLIDPTAEWRLQILESVDGGQSFTFAFGNPDAGDWDHGRVGRTEPPFAMLNDPNMAGRQVLGRIVLNRAMNIGATLEIG